MTRVWQSGGETGNAVSGESEFGGSQTLTNFSFDTSIKRSGLRSLKFASGAAGYLESTTGHDMNAAGFRAYVRIAGAPTATVAIMGLAIPTDVFKVYMRLRPDRALELMHSGTILVTSSQVLATGTFEQYLELWCNVDTHQVAMRLNGLVIGQAVVPTFDTSGPMDRAVLGPYSGNLGTDIWFDDCALNSGIGMQNSSWPGPGRIVMMTPAEDRFHVGWVDQNPGDPFYAEVDDFPGAADTTTYIKEAAGVTAVAEFYMTEPPVVGIVAACLMGIRGGGTGTSDRSAQGVWVDANNYVARGPAINWNLAGWKTVYPAFVAEEAWDGVPRPLNTDMLFGRSYLPSPPGRGFDEPGVVVPNTRLGCLRIERTDTNATEIRITTIWASVDVAIPYGTPTRFENAAPRILLEIDSPGEG